MVEKGVMFDIEESKGDWFDFFESKIDLNTGNIIYDDPKPGTGKACFRPSRPLIMERIAKRKKESEFVLNPKTRSMEKVEYYKSQTAEELQKDQDDITDYVITGLKDFYDSKGNTIECTRENKLKLVKVPVFDRFMARCMEIQMNASLKQKEKEEKNSGKP
jgi:hypothetical protein